MTKKILDRQTLIVFFAKFKELASLIALGVSFHSFPALMQYLAIPLRIYFVNVGNFIITDICIT